MKQYSLRQLYSGLGKAIEDLPFEITNHNVVVAVVMAPEEDEAILHAIKNKPTSPLQVTKEGKFIKSVSHSPSVSVTTNKPKIIKTTNDIKDRLPSFRKQCKVCGAGLDQYGQFCLGKGHHKQ